MFDEFFTINYQSSTINPINASFDKNNQADIVVAISLNGNTLASIADGTAELVKDTDYVVSESTVTIKKEYLGTLAVGSMELIFVFSAGNDQTLSINITDSTPVIQMWTVDPLQKIKDSDVMPSSAKCSFGLTMAKNEYECYQIALRSTEGFQIQNVKFENFPGDIEWEYRFVDYIDETSRMDYSVITTGPDTLYPYNSGVPDPLSNDTTRTVEANKTQPVFIMAKTGKGTATGKFSGKVKVTTDKGVISISGTVDIYGVVLPDTKDCDFTVYNWSSDIGYSFSPQWDALKLHYGNPTRYSPEWWEILGNFADEMIRTRQNMQFVNTPQLLLDGGTTVDSDGNVTFNWSKFKEYIQFYIDKGFRKFGGMHLAFHWDGTQNYAGGRNASGMLAYDPGSGKTVWTGKDIMGGETLKWLEQYLPQLAATLDSIELPDSGGKTVYDVWYQHIFDEPYYAPEGGAKWKYLTEKVIELAVIKDEDGNVLKKMKTVDADAHGDLTGYSNIASAWCPEERLYEANKVFYDDQRALGKDIFLYICVNPPEPWLNRFVSQPTYTSQLIYWYCYQNKIDALLHWAWNVWAGGYMNGDSYLVYPDPVNKTVKSSLRAEAMRDGIEDVELFKIIEKRDAALAKELVDAVIKGGESYSNEIGYIRNIRNLLVKTAAGEEITIPGSGA
ncbi:MAG: X2-like carbohydrate binding domain-containing protein [Clostridiaceae bacterium]